jgi:hypothetical protein
MASVWSFTRRQRKSAQKTVATYRHIENIESDTTHILLSANAFPGRPLQGSDTRILDFIEVLHTLRDIDHQVGTSRIGSEGPDLPGIGDIPTIIVCKYTGAGLKIIARADLASLNCLGQFFVERQRLHVDTIVLVLRF